MGFAFPEQRVKLGAIALIFLGLTGCTSKTSQCQKLIEVVNRGNALIYYRSDKQDATTTRQLAKELDGIATQVETLKLPDKKLTALQTNSTATFRNLAAALTEMGQALEQGEKAPATSEGKQQLLKAKEQLTRASQLATQAAEKADGLTDEMISYCPQSVTTDSGRNPNPNKSSE